MATSSASSAAISSSRCCSHSTSRLASTASPRFRLAMAHHARDSDVGCQAPFWCQRTDKRVLGFAMGRLVLDRGLAAGLYSILGLGQSAALVRYRGDSCMRGIVVGEFPVDFQPGSQFAGGGNLLVHRHCVAALDGAISGRRNRVYVGHARTDLGAAAFQLSHRSSPGVALGHAEDWLRPPCSGIAGRDCRGAFRRLAVFAIGVQYELCVPRSSLSSLLGACSRAPRRNVCRSSRAALLADPSFFELDVSGGERRQLMTRMRQGSQDRKEMGADSDKNREKYLTMLKTAVEEARLGLGEGGIPIGAALFERNGKLLGSGHNRRVQEGDPSAHGETDAFRKAGRQRSYRDKIMVTTLAPC